MQHIDVKFKHKALDKVLVPKTQNSNLDKLCSHNKEHKSSTMYYCNKKTPNSPKGKIKNNKKNNNIKCYNSIIRAS